MLDFLELKIGGFLINIKKLESELKALPKGGIMLIETAAENALEMSISAIKILTRKNYTGIILSASRPCRNLLDIYNNNRIDTKKVAVLCAVCRSQGVNTKDSFNVLHLEKLSALTQISISINETINSIKGDKFIFIDSVTTMLIHNQPNTFAMFIHNVLTKMRVNGVDGYLISLETETNKEVRAEIAQLCDKVVRV